MENKSFRCTNISRNGQKGLFFMNNTQLSVYDVVRILNEQNEIIDDLSTKLRDISRQNEEFRRGAEEDSRKIRELEKEIDDEKYKTK